jgi:hypothetical protein
LQVLQISRAIRKGNEHGSWPLVGNIRLTGAVIVLLSACFLLQISVDAEVKETRRVLILNDLGIISSPGFAEIDQSVFAGLQKSPYQIELYHESLEITLFPDKVSQGSYKGERKELWRLVGSANGQVFEVLSGLSANRK